MSRLFKPTTLGLLTGLLLGLAGPASAAVTDYDFAPLVQRQAPSGPASAGVPALADNGRAAQTAELRGNARGLMRTEGDTAVLLARGRQFDRFGGVSINRRGQVAFEGSPADGLGEGIYRADGQRIELIAGSRDLGDFDFVGLRPSINRRGQVAFIGERIVGGQYVDGVWLGEGGPVQALADENGPLDDFTGDPSLNDRGEVAFLARMDSGVGGLFISDGSRLTQVADDSGILTGIYGFSDPALNNRGEVAFSAGTNPDPGDNGGSTGSGIFLWRNGVLNTVLQGTLAEYFTLRQPSLNNLGQIAFVVEPTFADQILVTGPDLVRDRVIGRGDRVGGRLVKGVLFGREGLNDAGQLAFTAIFADGSSQGFLATPKAPAQR